MYSVTFYWEKKTIFLLFQQVSIANSFLVRDETLFFLFILPAELLLSYNFSILVHIVIVSAIHMPVSPVVSQRPVFYSQLLALIISQSHLLCRALSFRGGSLSKTSHLGLSSPKRLTKCKILDLIVNYLLLKKKLL